MEGGTDNTAQRIREEVIELLPASIAGLKVSLQSALRRKNLEVLISSNANFLRNMFRKSGGLKTQPPFVVLFPSSFAPATGSYNPWALKKIGAKMGIDSSGSHIVMFHVFPVETTFTVSYVTESIDDFLQWVDVWFYQHNQLSFKLRIKETDTVIDILVEANPGVNTPVFESEIDTGPYSIAESQMTMKTFTGIMVRQPVVRDIRANMIIPPVQTFRKYFDDRHVPWPARLDNFVNSVSQLRGITTTIEFILTNDNPEYNDLSKLQLITTRTKS